MDVSISIQKPAPRSLCTTLPSTSCASYTTTTIRRGKSTWGHVSNVVSHHHFQVRHDELPRPSLCEFLHALRPICLPFAFHKFSTKIHAHRRISLHQFQINLQCLLCRGFKSPTHAHRNVNVAPPTLSERTFDSVHALRSRPKTNRNMYIPSTL
jgi:hypothetical protein